VPTHRVVGKGNGMMCRCVLRHGMALVLSGAPKKMVATETGAGDDV
jgi:hypothetical protein